MTGHMRDEEKPKANPWNLSSVMSVRELRNLPERSFRNRKRTEFMGEVMVKE